MRQVLLAVSVVLVVVLPSSAYAKRLASNSQKSAIVRALTAPQALCFRYGSHTSCSAAISRGIPLRCVTVYISTVNPAWASETDVLSRSCANWDANGGAIVHVQHHRWVVFTEGSAFTMCPIRGYSGQGSMPEPVAKDLLGFC